MYVFVDADYIVYSAGFACEEAKYLVECETPDGTEHFDVMDTAAGAAIWLDRDNWPFGTKIREPVRVVDARPLSHAKQLVRQIKKKIERRAVELSGEPLDEITYYLTGPGNYREQLATIRPYKGNRAALHKPYWYKELREYLVEQGAKMVCGKEADDQVVIDAIAVGSLDLAIIASVDKDHLQVPGYLYNWQKDTLTYTTPKEGLVAFYRQILTGDVTDNIAGCFKCGEKRAAELIHHKLTEEEMYVECLAEYQESLGRKGCPYANLSAEDALLETGRLVWMQRSPDDLWAPPHVRANPDQHPEVATSVASWLTSRNAGSTTSTSPEPSPSSSTSPDSSAKPAEASSRARRGTRRTSGSEGSTTGSKRKGSSRRTTAAGSRRSTRSTSKSSPASSSESSSCATTGSPSPSASDIATGPRSSE